MAKKSTRGKVRDSIDYSELLLEIKTNDTETFTEKEVMTDADGNSYGSGAFVYLTPGTYKLTSEKLWKTATLSLLFCLIEKMSVL